MNMKNTINISVGVILLILVGVVLMQRGQRRNSVEKEHRALAVSNIQTDVQHFNVVTNLKPAISNSENASAVVESVGLQSVIPSAEPPGCDQINIAGRRYPVLFEGQDVSAKLKRIIIDDLALNLSHLEHIDFMELPSKEEEPAAQMYQKKVTHWLDAGRQQRYFPDAVEKYFGGTVRHNDTFQLIIHEKLVEEYKQALELKTDHVEMFEKLDEFIKLLCNKEALNLLAENSDASRSMLYFLGRPQPTSEEKYRTLVRSCLDLWIRHPSLLDVKPLEDMVKQGTLAGQDDYAFSTLVSDAGKKNEYLMKVPMGVFMDRKWRILAMPSP